ncbi:MAG: glycosyltransferase [Alphaproteobacteria bacterium]|nr:glycosyltransferase [Alphaproteobacteria bacterium]
MLSVKNILTVTHYYPGHGGGIERVAAKLQEMLAAPDTHFTWAASDCDAPPAIPGVKPMPMRTNNFIERTSGLPVPLWSLDSLKELWRAVEVHDAVWLHDTLYIGNIVAYFAARHFKKPILITQHTGPCPFRSVTLRALLPMLLYLVSTPMLRFADHVVFISDFVAEFFRARASLPHARMVPNGVDSTIFRPVDDAERERLRIAHNLDPDQPVALYVGRFVARKGLPVLHELARKMTHINWVFAGAGAGRGSTLDPARWQHRNVLTWHNIGQGALARLYQLADFLVLPSVGEGFPLVVQEAMACGLPVVCSEDAASGSYAARGYFTTLPVDISHVAATAKLWETAITGNLSGGPATAQRRAELASFAANMWHWDHVAAIYRELLHAS